MGAWYRHFRCLDPAPTALAVGLAIPDPAAAATASVVAAASGSASASAAAASTAFDAPDTPSMTASLSAPSEVADLRQRVEDITGCIPLYLRCFVGCTASTFAATWQERFAKDKRVQRVFNHLLDFYREWRKSRGESGWRWQIDALRSFLLNGKAPLGSPRSLQRDLSAI